MNQHGRAIPDAFEWDEAKAAGNLAKHGVRFNLAVAAFLDERRIDSTDDRRDYGEERRTVIASIEGRLYVVVYVMRDPICRIISARPANRKERRIYHGQI